MGRVESAVRAGRYDPTARRRADGKKAQDHCHQASLLPVPMMLEPAHEEWVTKTPVLSVHKKKEPSITPNAVKVGRARCGEFRVGLGIPCSGGVNE